MDLGSDESNLSHLQGHSLAGSSSKVCGPSGAYEELRGKGGLKPIVTQPMGRKSHRVIKKEQ